MGEYATRKSDGERIKIGTCESMYYLRYEDRFKVNKDDHSIDPRDCLNLFWRLPFPDEDKIDIGNYEDYHRGLQLYRLTKDGWSENFSSPDLAEVPGLIQLTHKSGLLINVPCYHGEKLPELGDAKAAWNGKSHSYELAHIKNMSDGVWPVIHCRHCGKMWRTDWADIWEFIPTDMQARLTVYSGLPVTPKMEIAP